MPASLIDRRDLLRSAGAGMLALLSPRGAEAFSRADAVYATAFARRGGGYGMALLGEDGAFIRTVDLPDRGHDIAHDAASGRMVVFACQPGTFALAFDLSGRVEPTVIASVPGRHFFGHGVFSRDGRLLYATENDYGAAAGMIGVYEAKDGYRRIGEFPTHGVGSHELLLMPDGHTLCVANGGIETHPDFGHAKLNLATMQPSIAYLDRDTGALLARFALAPALHQLSIRHMDLDAEGRVWFGCQHEGPASERPPLAGRVDRDGGVVLASMPHEVLDGFRNYVGSVAANREAGTVALSSPQGNLLAVLDARTGDVVASAPLREVCGIARDGRGFAATTGAGHFRAAAGSDRDEPDLAFDNHLVRIG